MPLTIRDLLADKAYREFFMTKPAVLLPVATSPAWWVYFQKKPDGAWARTSADTYVQAYKLLKPRINQYHDICIVSKRQAFRPPTKTARITRHGQPVMVKSASGLMVQQTRVVDWSFVKLLATIEPTATEVQNTRWCTYCRRPTLFTYFPRHHAFKGAPAYDPTRRRCSICGIAKDSI